MYVAPVLTCFCFTRTVTDALAYVEYITNTIRNKELFHSIDTKFSHVS